MRELDERYGPRGVLFIGVNSNNWETREEVVEHAPLASHAGLY